MQIPRRNRPQGKKADISDPAEFYRQGLGPGYPEEEFGPGDRLRKKPEEPASIRNWRGDPYSRFDRPARKPSSHKVPPAKR